MKRLFCLITIAFAISGLTAVSVPAQGQDPNDPGAPDSVIIDLSCALRYGNDSMRVPVMVINDEIITAAIIPIAYTSPDKYWRVDTAYFTSDRWQISAIQGFVDRFDDDPDTAKYVIYNHSLIPFQPGWDTIATLHLVKDPAAPSAPVPITFGYTRVEPTIGGVAFHYSFPIMEIYPICVVSNPCNCTMNGDHNADGSINPLDVVNLVNYVYRSLDLRAQQIGCPTESGDWNCDEMVNPVDVVYTVNYVYRWPSIGPCNPCSWTGDEDPPEAITDLTVLESNPGALTVGWTAPGNDGDIGTASQYEIKYATVPLTPENWNTAAAFTRPPSPLPAGTAQQATIPLLSPANTYYVAIRTVDAAGNWSDISNVVSGVPQPDITVTFPDVNLRAGILYHLGRSSGEIYASELLTLVHLRLQFQNISDLTGLEYCSNAVNLSLESNYITDISPLSSLTKLTYLQLSGNIVVDIGPLSGMTGMRTLVIAYCGIEDLSPVSAMAKLEFLFAQVNSFTDVSAVSGLTFLQYLLLSSNQIVDIAPLVANAGLAEGDMINLTVNPLSEESINVYVPALEARGATVYY